MRNANVEHTYIIASSTRKKKIKTLPAIGEKIGIVDADSNF